MRLRIKPSSNSNQVSLCLKFCYRNLYYPRKLFLVVHGRTDRRTERNWGNMKSARIPLKGSPALGTLQAGWNFLKLPNLIMFVQKSQILLYLMFYPNKIFWGCHFPNANALIAGEPCNRMRALFMFPQFLSFRRSVQMWTAKNSFLG